MLGLRHYHHQKVKKEGKVAHSRFAKALDLLIYPIAAAGPLALLPQAFKLYSTHDAHGLAFSSWAILGCLNIMWLTYGIVHRAWPIVMTNAALMLLNFSVAAGIIIYTR